MKRDDFKKIIKLRSIWKIDRRKGNYTLPNGEKLTIYVKKLVESQMKIDNLLIASNGISELAENGTLKENNLMISPFARRFQKMKFAHLTTWQAKQKHLRLLPMVANCILLRSFCRSSCTLPGLHRLRSGKRAGVRAPGQEKDPAKYQHRFWSELHPESMLLFAYRCASGQMIRIQFWAHLYVVCHRHLLQTACIMVSFSCALPPWIWYHAGKIHATYLQAHTSVLSWNQL